MKGGNIYVKRNIIREVVKKITKADAVNLYRVRIATKIRRL